MESNKIKIFKFILFLIIISSILLLTIELMPFMKNISTQAGQEHFRDKINSMGIKGFFLLSALQMSQIFLLIFPGEPFEVLAGMCYGTIGGMIFIFATVFLSTAIIYFLVRRYKEKYLYNFFKKEKIQKLVNSKWYNNPKKTEKILLILFLIPGVPKDLIAYCGALLNIKPIRFLLIATFARFPSVISSTMVGANMLNGDWKTVGVIYVITAIFTFLLISIFTILDKDKISKDIVRSIK